MSRFEFKTILGLEITLPASVTSTTQIRESSRKKSSMELQWPAGTGDARTQDLGKLSVDTATITVDGLTAPFTGRRISTWATGADGGFPVTGLIRGHDLVGLTVQNPWR
jgi:hypothetical protein